LGQANSLDPAVQAIAAALLEIARAVEQLAAEVDSLD
jgi:hypothetical protein